MKKKEPVKKAAKAAGKKKAPDPELPSDEEIKELESLEIPEKIKKEFCQEVAEKMGISSEEVRDIMEELESGIPSRKSK
jgi:hypothetical protein